MSGRVTLDGYVVRKATERAIGVVKNNVPIGRSQDITWIPRALVTDGHVLEEGDTDIIVPETIADEKCLDY